MNGRVRNTAPETRERIERVADMLFRRVGFTKIAVADIAAELGMSPANVYRFFPSKAAIVAAVCRRCLSKIDREAAEIVAGPGTPQQRLAALCKAILGYHTTNFLNERRVHDIVIAAIENNWESIEAHKAHIRSLVARLLEEGSAEGIFVPHDPQQVSGLVLGALVRYCHPALVAQRINDKSDVDVDASVAFLLRSIEVTRTPLI